jgi:hypothetical protein
VDELRWRMNVPADMEHVWLNVTPVAGDQARV